MLALPSGRLLKKYKNSCDQNPGLNDSVGHWMAMEAAKRKLGPEGREGGIILDEMSIQVCCSTSYISIVVSKYVLTKVKAKMLWGCFEICSNLCKPYILLHSLSNLSNTSLQKLYPNTIQ